MNEKLIIRNFGPIRSVELELSRFNVLIGEQATGKSTIAKVLAMCRYFSYVVTDHTDVPWLKDKFANGLEEWGLSEYVKESTYIQYDCDHYSFSFQVSVISEYEEGYGEKQFFSYTQNIRAISEGFKNLLSNYEALLLESDDFDTVPASFFQKYVTQLMNNPFFIPTERGLQSIFSLGKSSIQNITDVLFNQLARLDQITRNFKTDTIVEPLGITYKNINGGGFVKKTNQNDFTSLNHAARGYQSTIPVVLVIKYYTEFRKKKKTFIVEEPEMNLFPAAQQKLVQFLADQVNSHGHSMLITTHSPYVLTSLNNLIEAHKAGQSHPEEVNKVIDRKHWLNADDVRVFMLHPDGTCEDIFDREGGLIKAEKIDAVSALLNDQFDNLLELEFGEK